MSEVKTASFRGKTYQIQFTDKIYGYCENEEVQKKDEGWRAITISLDQTEKQTLDTIIHEAQHASFPGMSEEDVTQSSQDIARLLWRLGYRKKD